MIPWEMISRNRPMVKRNVRKKDCHENEKKETKGMTERRRQDLMDSISHCAEVLEKQTVSDVLRLHGSEFIDELSTAELEDVFGELFQREADSKN